MTGRSSHHFRHPQLSTPGCDCTKAKANARPVQGGAKSSQVLLSGIHGEGVGGVQVAGYMARLAHRTSAQGAALVASEFPGIAMGEDQACAALNPTLQA